MTPSSALASITLFSAVHALNSTALHAQENEISSIGISSSGLAQANNPTVMHQSENRSPSVIHRLIQAGVAGAMR